ncbi:MAG: hypothetical protein KJ025_19795 [Burkholderiales bacterium]|nr:hypothetical protein [Burkholderiales bacterium]
MIRIILAAALTIAAGAAPAADMPLPKVFRDGGFQQGQWRMEILEMRAKGVDQAGDAMRAMSMCMDSAEKMARGSDDAARDCAFRVLKDTASEAEMEITCKDGTTRSKITREGNRRFLMQATTSSGGETMSMKARYAYEGPCRQGAGPGSLSVDQQDPRCRQALAQAAQMDPAVVCANAGAQRAMCEEQLRKSRAQIQSMCR